MCVIYIEGTKEGRKDWNVKSVKSDADLTKTIKETRCRKIIKFIGKIGKKS